MFGVALLETLVTMAGVNLVRRTLMATWAAQKEAKRAAHATVASMENTAKLQLRAYVGIEKVAREPNKIWPPQFVITIKNSGQTIAHNVKVRTGEISADVEPEVGTFHLRVPGYEVPIAPGSGTEHLLLASDFEPLTNQVSYANFVNGRGPTPYVRGVIEYDDIFKNAHSTAFFFSYGADDIDENVSFCGTGNKAS